ncbi:MAG: glutaconate CoA-transferase, partial [Candidatus Neomarinimicrobiota bacterium]
TDLCTLAFDEKTKRMKLLALNPGITTNDVVDNTGFELIIPNKIEQNEVPSIEELQILREEVDQDRYYI